MICKYEFKKAGGFKCKETADPGQDYCILHREFPEDARSEEFKEIQSLKHQKFDEKIENKDYNFIGARLNTIIFSGKDIDLSISAGSSKPLDFRGAHIRNNAFFIGSKIRVVYLFCVVAVRNHDFLHEFIYCPNMIC